MSSIDSRHASRYNGRTNTKGTRENNSMGVISILLGIIAFLGFTGAGAFMSNKLMNNYTFFGFSSSTQFIIVMVSIFAFIGLLICMNLVMSGLTYNKLSKMRKQMKRKV